jgi:hypothetical protein
VVLMIEARELSKVLLTRTVDLVTLDVTRVVPVPRNLRID